MRRPTPQSRLQALKATEVPETAPVSVGGDTLRDRMETGIFTATGWVPPASLSDDAWLRVGGVILALERATPWFWGDWYLQAGDRTLPANWQGPQAHTLETYAVVARAFPNSGRLEFLSFSHHQEVASLGMAERDELLNWAIARQASVAALRAERQRRAAALLPPSKPPLLIEATVTTTKSESVVLTPIITTTKREPLVVPKGEPPPAPGGAVPVTVLLSPSLHAWVREAAAAERLDDLAAWIVRQIEGLRMLEELRE